MTTRSPLCAAWLTAAVTLTVTCATAQSYTPGVGLSGPPEERSPVLRPWDLTLRALAGYNDNVALIPRQTTARGSKGSPQQALTLDGQYRLVQRRDRVVGVAF